jgi:hypothetical protein
MLVAGACYRGILVFVLNVTMCVCVPFLYFLSMQTLQQRIFNNNAFLVSSTSLTDVKTYVV